MCEMKKYMRFTQDEKHEIIRIVTHGDLSVNRTLQELGLHKRTFYNWYSRYLKHGYDGLAPKAKGRQQTWNKVPQKQRNEVVNQALEHPNMSCRELATHIVDKHKWFISESSVYRILKARGLITAPTHIVISAANEFKNKTSRVNQMWQTDFTYFKVIGWGWYYLSTVLDDYSRFIIHWDLCSNMTSEDVKPTINMALLKSGLTRNTAPVLLSDNGSCYISSEIKTFFKKQGIKPINGRPSHPQTQGKIERYHRTMKNIVKLHNYYSPEELKAAIEKFVNFYNYNRYHESLNNLTPADVYFGKGELILNERKRIKIKTLKNRRQLYFTQKFVKTVNE